MLDTYSTIELYGLTENGTDDLPIPSDDELRDQIINETFETLIGGLQGTGLASEIEPIAHGLATLLQRRAKLIADQADKLKVKIKALIEVQDGSEIAEVELDTASESYTVLSENADALEIMAERARNGGRAGLFKNGTSQRIDISQHRESMSGAIAGNFRFVREAIFCPKRFRDVPLVVSDIRENVLSDILRTRCKQTGDLFD